MAVESVTYATINGQVFRPIHLRHTRSRLDYNIRKFVSEQLPIHVMNVASKLPLSVKGQLQKGVKDLRKIQDIFK